MEFSEYLSLVFRKKQTIASVLLLFIFLAVILTFIQPFRYSAEASMLIVRDYTPGVDPYQVSKSNEYVAKVLAAVVNSGSFYNEVLGAGFKIDRGYFSDDAKEQRKTWQKTMAASAAADAGILRLTVLHPDKSQADQIVRAVVSTLKSKHQQYHGAGAAIALNVIDQPFISPYPVKPNIPANLLLAVLFGLIFSFSYIYLFPGERFNLKFWPSLGKNRTKVKYDPVYGREAALMTRKEEYSPAGKYGQAELADNRIYAAAPGTPDGNYSFYYHGYNHGGKIKAEAAPNYDKNGLGYEDIIGQGRMENVIGR